MSEVVFERFRGLDLTSDPGEIGGETAIGLSNVELDLAGRVRTRRGSTRFADPADAGVTDFAQIAASGANLLAFSTAGGIYRIENGGGFTSIITSLAVAGTVSEDFISSARLGTPTATYTYLAFGGNQTLMRYDNATTVAASTGKPYFVASWQNRVVQARYDAAANTPSAANGSASTVFFSDPGAPGTYPATNFVHLSPGDGDMIRGMVTWRDRVFVFKDTSMYVFYGISADSTGAAVFNYQQIDLGFRVSTSNHAVTAGPDGVYVAGYDGVYRTVGDVPVRVSLPLDPLFPFTDPPTIAAADRFVIVGGGPSDYDWVLFDPIRGEWLSWEAPGLAGAIPTGWTLSDREYIFYPAQASPRGVYVMDDQFTDDTGTAIAWSWQSGWYDLGSPSSKRVGPITVWGSGTVTASLFQDYGSTDASSSSVTLGTYPAVARTRQLKTRRGRRFSHKLSGSGFAVAHRVGLTVRDQRVS